MPENKMSDIIRESLDGIKEFADVNTIFGQAIITSGGVTVIPVSKVSVGFASGGLDYTSEKKLIAPVNFGGGSGSGVSVTPVAFLTINPNSEINLIEIGKSQSKDTLERAMNLIENSPDIIKRIKDSFTG